MNTQPTAPHIWRFFRAGGFDQVRIETGEDLLALDTLDQKLWVALACPTGGVDFDKATLALLDADGDGRIRAADIAATARWLRQVVETPEDLVAGRQDVRLAAIRVATPEGKVLHDAARSILASLGKPDCQTIGLADIQDTGRIFGQTRFNGDGIVPAEAAPDETVAQVVRDIIDCLGSAQDRSGLPGIDQERIDRFYGQLDQLAAWHAEAAALTGIVNLGDGAEAAGLALEAVQDKIDGFFLRCRLAAFSPAASGAVNPPPETFAPLINMPLADSLALLAPLPLAAAFQDCDLPLKDGVNPAWKGAVDEFRRSVLMPVLDRDDTLSEADWEELKARFATHTEWRTRQPATDIARLGAARIQAILSLVPKDRLDALIAADSALEDEAAALDDIRRLVLLTRDFFRLANNFVSFREFYSRQGWAVFQAGTLFFDGRSADLCVWVDDPIKHAQLATLGRICLVYCDCVRQGGAEKATIAAAFTAGDADQLMVGRNGIFYDRQGRDWDASIVKIIDHPISMRQAFWSPYRQAARFIGGQIEKVAAAKAKALETNVTKAVATPATPAPTTPTPAPAAAPPAAFDVGKFAGIFAALGLAVGAIGTAIASIITGFLHLPWWQMPLALGGLVLAVSGPSVLIAFLKLRQRSLAPILDASGWAVNGRARINIPFGGSLTALAKLPEGAERTLVDPYAEKRQPWRLYLFLGAGLGAAVLYLWHFGWP